GFVGLTDIDPGFRVGLDTPITTLDDRRVLYVDFAVPEDVFGQLQVGSEVTATAFSEGDRSRPAEIVYLDSRVDPNSRAFRARAALDNSDDTLRPGMSFEIRFSIPGRLYPSVPEAAIVWGSNGSYLWAVRDGAATQIPVQIIARQDGRVLVEGDLRRGNIIVAEGVQKVREGTKVVLLSSASSTSSQGAAPAAPGALD
ncbi:MAG: efflux RND transporter periplasmic adaptor subunit, partial [Pseudomonadota bacterium]